MSLIHDIERAHRTSGLVITPRHLHEVDNAAYWRGVHAMCPYRCVYCGAPSAVDPSEQERPATTCDDNNHGYPL